jgi:ATP-binding cassette subfamily C protein
LLVASLFEGVGLATLLPLLTVATGSEVSETSAVNKVVLDALNYVGLEPDLAVLISIVVVALVLKAVINFVAMVHVGYSVARVQTGLRTELLKNLLQVRWSYFTTRPVGRFANSMSTDANRAGATCRKAAEFLAGAIEAFVYLCLALFMSWRLTLIAFAIGGLVLLVPTYLVQVSRKAGQKQTDRTRQFVSFLTDVLNNIRPLKAMGKQASFSVLLDRKIVLLRKALRRQVLSVQSLQAMQDILIALAAGIGFYVALEYAKFGATELLVMGLIILKVIKNMASVQRHYQNAVLLESPYYAMEDLIEETNQAQEVLHGGLAPDLREGCKFENVRFSYGGKNVLKDLSLEIPAGQVTVLTGPSGVGKTTVADLLLGFFEPASGEVAVDGVPLSRIDLTRWRQKIGYVPQELSLLHDTIVANVALGDPRVDEEEVRRALKLAGLSEFIESLPEGLKTQVGEKGSQISGGQRQRLALARALAGRPRLLILDEVTSALDSETEDALCATFRRLAGDLTILAISHRPRLVDFADRVYQLADGRATRIVQPPVLAASQDA